MSDRPLWMPPGSVRALMAMLIISTTCYMSIKQLPIPEFLKLLGSGVIGFYFGQKVGQKSG